MGSARKELIPNHGSLEINDDHTKIAQLQLRRDDDDDDDDGMRDKRANSLRRSAATVFTLHRNARAAVALNHGYDVNVRRKEEKERRRQRRRRLNLESEATGGPTAWTARDQRVALLFT